MVTKSLRAHVLSAEDSAGKHWGLKSVTQLPHLWKPWSFKICLWVRTEGEMLRWKEFRDVSLSAIWPVPLEEGRRQGGTDWIACDAESGTAMYELGRTFLKELAVPKAPLLRFSLWNCEKLTVCPWHHPGGPMLWHPQQYSRPLGHTKVIWWTADMASEVKDTMSTSTDRLQSCGKHPPLLQTVFNDCCTHCSAWEVVR